MDENNISSKSRLAALLLCFFLGGLGIHRFYVGKVGTGILMIFTLGGLGIWVLIDLILIVIGSFGDKDGKIVHKWS
ncbi:MAG: TM2 domain-containing protein [Candidatus Omnitrophota bacterium]|jgi:TM2 domain-containing membrane protein YozV